MGVCLALSQVSLRAEQGEGERSRVGAMTKISSLRVDTPELARQVLLEAPRPPQPKTDHFMVVGNLSVLWPRRGGLLRLVPGGSRAEYQLDIDPDVGQPDQQTVHRVVSHASELYVGTVAQILATIEQRLLMALVHTCKSAAAEKALCAMHTVFQRQLAELGRLANFGPSAANDGR